MTSADVDYNDLASASTENERLAPLPTEDMARRSVGIDLHASRNRRNTTESIDTFSSDTSFASDDPSKIVEIGNLRFMNDCDMQDGQSSILGKGAFAMVRLARRHNLRQFQRGASRVSRLTTMSDRLTNTSDYYAEPDHREENLNSSECGSEDGGLKDSDGAEELVAVKIFEKSLLQKCRTVERDDDNQMQVRTALDKVEQEIAVMKMIQHPNLVCLHEVIDTGSNRLYMVLEYLLLGEIMTNVRGTGMYKRRSTRRGEQELSGVTSGGYFDEHHAALYFVDIMHGLAHLHKNHIVHRDLKPENILLDSRGFAKIGDFGVAHLFEDEMTSAGHSSSSALSTSSLDTNSDSRAALLSRKESEAALNMDSMNDMGKLTKTEGTWAYWSPEMCAENSLIFSGYACDIWAAGICLYIFATGKLPFYTEIPLVLFDLIADAKIELDSLNLSDAIVDILKKVLTKDPCARAGVGDCLKHPFCNGARGQRIKELGEEVEQHEEIIVPHEDMQQALSATNGNPLGDLARGIMSHLSEMKPNLSGITSAQGSQASNSDDCIDESEPRRKSRRLSISKSFRSFLLTLRQSQNEMSMDDQEDEGESGTRVRRRSFPSSLFR